LGGGFFLKKGKAKAKNIRAFGHKQPNIKKPRLCFFVNRKGKFPRVTKQTPPQKPEKKKKNSPGEKGLGKTKTKQEKTTGGWGKNKNKKTPRGCPPHPTTPKKPPLGLGVKKRPPPPPPHPPKKTTNFLGLVERNPDNHGFGKRGLGFPRFPKGTRWPTNQKGGAGLLP